MSSRGITGFSMGGYGAMHLALNFPNSFSVVVAQSGYYDTADAVTDGALKEDRARQSNDIRSNREHDLATAGAFSLLPSAVPNPSLPPFYYDPPYTFGNGQYTTNQNTMQRLRDADIAHGALGKFLQQTIEFARHQDCPRHIRFSGPSLAGAHATPGATECRIGSPL
jgi:S-formylglutathione hydrolase FrmB